MFFKKTFIASLCTLLFATAAQALEVAPLVGVRDDTMTASSDSGATFNSTFGGWRLGGLLFLDIVPGVNLRTGVIYDNVLLNGTFTGISDFKSTESILSFPVNVQVNFPIALYVYGGFMYSSVQSTTCSASNPLVTCSIAKNDDMPLDLGVGYNLIDMELMKFSLEAEYDYGTRNLTASTGSMYFRGFALNAVLRLGF